MDFTESTVDEPSIAKIGAGSFATVYVVRGGPIAYKQKIYLECQADSFFNIPRPFAFNDPDLHPDGFISCSPSPIPGQRHPTSSRPHVTPGLMVPFIKATYAMDRVLAFPYDASKAIVSAYFPANLQDATISLCRLYFGMIYPTTSRPRFVTASNFPLDEHRYTKLLESFPEFLQPVRAVAHGMGEMLAKLHYNAGVDGRDIEFVLGGSGGADFVYFVIDFNQIRAWSKGPDVSTLVSAFFENDPYYPRPVPNNQLYVSFKAGYLEACDPSDMTLAATFLQAIENEQATRSLR
ncbi:hypothetical protein EUX98_g5459 [Antrodiella citrinella]|uniref:DUF3669 domain-containing protein n=1 Tax=Antrodiella citrinella TaxID=2447956 RepID=A0A4V3XID4_9APHY|nr:hypothetical protein EUX98_g5459 [Antrodiella citrinella]